MRTLSLTILITFAVIAGASVASAQSTYVSVIGGANFTHEGEFGGFGVDSEFETGYAVGGAIGFDFGDYRLEGEVSYRTNDIDNIGGRKRMFGRAFDGNITTTAVMANALYDFDSGSSFVPYVGAGVGVGFSTLELLGGDGDVTEFAYQLILGGAYEMSSSLDLTLDYRLFSIGFPLGVPKYDFFGSDMSQVYWNSAIMLGVRAKF